MSNNSLVLSLINFIDSKGVQKTECLMTDRIGDEIALLDRSIMLQFKSLLESLNPVKHRMVTLLLRTLIARDCISKIMSCQRYQSFWKRVLKMSMGCQQSLIGFKSITILLLLSFTLAKMQKM